MREYFEFAGLHVLTAGAYGAPGKRTFFILAGQGNRCVRIWVEKEQLQALARAIDRLIAELPERRRPRGAEEAPEPTDRPEGLAGEFRAQSLALGYDREQGRAMLLINDETGDDEINAPMLRAWAEMAQMQAFSRRITTVCAAGRPLCPLCSFPMDPEGHVCPKANGHHPALRLT
ncbi:MAG: DUF3090 family protein [Chloroflexi bacterium]|nr:DUF3090 family protein [Chloroflexota bacterium]